jgi:hypothetical protein
LIETTLELDAESFNAKANQTSHQYSNCIYRHKWAKEILEFEIPMTEYDAITECRYLINDANNVFPFLTLVNKYYITQVYKNETIYNYFRPEYKIINNDYYRFKHHIHI